jgi:hypothetical protein
MGSIFQEIDGVLGMDFLNHHVVYLDFQHKKAYIGCANDVMFDDLRSKMALNQGS